MGKILSIAVWILTTMYATNAESSNRLPPDVLRLEINAIDTSSLSRVEVADLICLSLNIYHEARGSTHDNQLAVALVTRNRQKLLGGSICQIVYQRGQFSWTARRPGRPREVQPWLIAQRMAYSVLHGDEIHDITNGATHFHERTIRPHWSRSAITRQVIGAHVFMTIRGYGPPVEVAEAR